MRKILYILLFIPLYSNAQSPGSGNTLTFDGINDHITVPSGGGLNNLQSGTIEMWVKWNGSSQDAGFGSSFGAVLSRQSNTVFSNQVIALNGANPATAKIIWRPYSATTTSLVSLSSPGNNWTHIAIVYASGSHIMYINGVLERSSTTGGTIRNASAIPLSIGAWIGDGGCYSNAEIDEVRIWNDARTQTEIRDNMCHKLIGNEGNLIHYYRIDDATGTTLVDDVGTLDGTMQNMAIDDWIFSGAPIGNESVYSYNVTTSTSLNIASSDGDDLTASVTSITSTPGSMHVYRVDEKPNVITPPGTQAQLSQNTYYGVKVFGGSGVIYTVNYNYNGHPGIIDENNLELAKRDNNADATWSQEIATLNTTANTLILAGQTGTEYILATLGTDPLPIELLNFYAEINYNNYVQLTWQTVTEINNEYFTIERSENGLNWEEVIDIESKNPNSSSLLSYSTIDNNPYNGISYYRLKQTDFDGQFSYSQIRSVNIKGLERLEAGVFPNPSEDQITLEGSPIELEHIKIYNHLGQDVTLHTLIMERNEQKLVIDLSRLRDGAYYIKTKTTAKKVYKQ